VHLDLVTALQHGLAELDASVGKALASIHQSARLLSTMPGVSDVTAHVIVAEIVWI
jgi:transposase